MEEDINKEKELLWYNIYEIEIGFFRSFIGFSFISFNER